MSARPSALVLGAVALSSLIAGSARAVRPPEVIEAERRVQAAELDHLIRRADSLTAQVADRRGHLRGRLRSLYKLSQGGYVRLVLGAETPAQLFARRDAGKRVLDRDLGELSAIRGELSEIAGLREQLRERERSLARLGAMSREHRAAGPSAKGALVNPVRGARVDRPFGPFRDPQTRLEFTRDGVELACAAGDEVRAPGPGTVRHVGEVPGLGLAIIVDLGDGWATLLGRLAVPLVDVGDHVEAAQVIAQAATPLVHYQLEQDGVWIDPAPHLP